MRALRRKAASRTLTAPEGPTALLQRHMENRASKTRSVNIAFVADAELLRRLEMVLAESKALEYTVKYSDGTTVHYSDIEDIIKQPNAKPHSIVSVTAAAEDPKGQSGYVILRAMRPYSGHWSNCVYNNNYFRVA